MVAPRNVFAAGVPSATGGQGSRALSRPMRVEKPAERITPQMLGESAMARRYQRGGLSTSDATDDDRRVVIAAYNRSCRRVLHMGHWHLEDGMQECLHRDRLR